MAQIYRDGEVKIRPDVYYRYSNKGTAPAVAVDGINALVMKASWGPVGEVKSFSRIEDLRNAYGDCIGTEAAAAIFAEGASKVYVYRASGTAGAKASGDASGATITAKYEGVHPIKVKIQNKAGDAKAKQLLVLVGDTIKETIQFEAGATDSSNMAEAAKRSAYIDVTDAEAPITVTPAEITLAGGKDPTVTAEGYSAGFKALEPYYYTTISLDTIDEAIQALLKAYIDEAVKVGKFPIAIVSMEASKSLEEKIAKAKTYNDPQFGFIGNVYADAEGKAVNEVLAVSHLAGAVSATPSNQSIIHKVIEGATDVTEKFTNAQYEEAIEGGVILLSVNSDGQVWFDSGVTTLTTLSDNQDAGWKKMKRTKVRNELMHRINLAMEKKVGRVNGNSDGIAEIIQTGSGILKDMAYEGKIAEGGQFYLDEVNPPTTDSAWFVIEADDIDALEKIYLHYKFSVTPNA